MYAPRLPQHSRAAKGWRTAVSQYRPGALAHRLRPICGRPDYRSGSMPPRYWLPWLVLCVLVLLVSTGFGVLLLNAAAVVVRLPNRARLALVP